MSSGVAADDLRLAAREEDLVRLGFEEGITFGGGVNSIVSFLTLSAFKKMCGSKGQNIMLDRRIVAQLRQLMYETRLFDLENVEDSEGNIDDVFTLE